MSATVPMELSFGSGGNLKSAKRLRGLDLKDRLNNITNKGSTNTKPVFANTGQILKKAQRAGPITPRGGGFVPGTGSPIGGRSTIPPAPIIQDAVNQQGDADGGGAVVPEETARDIQQGAMGKPAGGGRGKVSTKTIAIGGGVAVVAIIIAYFIFFKKGRRKRKSKRKR